MIIELASQGSSGLLGTFVKPQRWMQSSEEVRDFIVNNEMGRECLVLGLAGFRSVMTHSAHNQGTKLLSHVGITLLSLTEHANKVQFIELWCTQGRKRMRENIYSSHPWDSGLYRSGQDMYQVCHNTPLCQAQVYKRVKIFQHHLTSVNPTTAQQHTKATSQHPSNID